MTHLNRQILPCFKSLRRQLSNSSNGNTHFGFQTVTEKEKSEKVYNVFHNVAKTYDLMNDAMSMGVHRVWKDWFMEKLAPAHTTQLIDVAGGTGDIAFRFLKSIDKSIKLLSTEGVPMIFRDDPRTHEINIDDISARVTVVDINEAMLEVGKERYKTGPRYKAGIDWVKGDAECLPFPENSFDAYTIAFGIRNCTHIDKVLAEAYRVLRPGGRFLCLEFSQVKNPVLSKLYDAYSFQVIPIMGYVIARDYESYKYLVESIRQFPNQSEFATMIRQAGFSAVHYQNLTFGTVAIHSGFKLV